MKKNLSSLVFILISLLTSCSNDDDNSDSTIKISGFIKSINNTPEENVKVSISNFENLTTSTDSEGYFQIEGITKGEHDLMIYKDNIDSNSKVFVQKIFKVSTNSDTELESLTLPNPVILDIPTEITASSALINWNNSSSDGFREYKLYRHNSSGLDETTGTLVHVSTDINETNFLDTNLNNSETYYYRVYVLDEFGQIGGSNIINFETNNVQIIKNGSFENVSNEDPLHWNLIPNDLNSPENSISIDNTQSTEGSNSLKFRNADVNGCFEQWIEQDIDNNILVKGATYKLIFDYKSDFILPNNNSVSLIIRNAGGDLDEWLYMDVDFFDDGQWRNNIFEFTLPSEFSNNNIDIDIHFCIAPTGYWWLDNISMERVN